MIKMAGLGVFMKQREQRPRSRGGFAALLNAGNGAARIVETFIPNASHRQKNREKPGGTAAGLLDSAR